MLIYLIKFSACLTILMVFYRLCLENERMHVIKRYYLLSALVFSLIVPLITFTEYVNVLPTTEIVQSTFNTVNTNNSTSHISVWIILIGTIYSLGLVVFGTKFLYNLFTIFKCIKGNPKYKSYAFINVLLKDLKVPHTFFHYIFLNQKKFEAQEIPNEVLLHEQAHAKQKHSIDILFIEILLVIFWFHPLIHLLKKAIKLNHEFLADQAVLNNGIESTVYQNLLLSFSFHSQEPQLANAINYSSIKKRFTIMKATTSKSSIWLRTIVIIPLIAITLYGFSNSKTILIDSDIETNQKEATKTQVLEYNRLAKHYNSQPKDQLIIKKKDLERLKHLYHLMSESQRTSAEEFPVVPPPPAPKAPAVPKSIEIRKLPAPKSPNAPAVPEVIELTKLPPPPPIPADATPEQKRKYKEAIKSYKLKAVKMKQHKKSLKQVKEASPPSSPPAPLDHVIEMSKKGAKFYYEGKKISSDEAIAIVKKNESIHISSRGSTTKQAVVHLSSKPMVVEIKVKN
ncbi:hypothetical protein A9Q87_02745 [Flavobacteriales bacterium 34_180_T64]|nr:hypothetical protein A9Q87_02745 [Flavobacteriales bacterium 34_180_T64]